MKRILEPLAHVAGLRLVALVTTDGVPIETLTPLGERGIGRGDERGEESGPRRGEGIDVAALAALATSWLAESTRAVAPLSWDVPRQLVLRAARGTLIVTQAPGAILVLLLAGGAVSTDLTLPIGATLARMQRHLKSIGQGTDAGPEPEGPLPSAPRGSGPGKASVHATENCSAPTRGE